MKCFYHGDKDGECSGALVYHLANITDKYGYGDPNKNNFIKVGYYKPFPIELIREDEQVYIVDFSIKPEEMREVLKITKNVIWIDHHKSAIEKYENFEYNIDGIRYDGISGCMLTYCYLKHMTNGGQNLEEVKPFTFNMMIDAPLFVKLFNDWDIWKFEYGDDTRKFQLASKCYDFSPVSTEWFRLILMNKDSKREKEMIEEAESMIKFRDAWAKDYMKLGFEVEFEGYKGFAVNIGFMNSEYFKSIPEDEYDLFIGYTYDMEKFVVQLRSEKINVREIAEKFGGGGHNSSAGFSVEQLPFKKIKREE